MAEEILGEAPDSTVVAKETITEASESTVDVQDTVKAAPESTVECEGDNNSAQVMELEIQIPNDSTTGAGGSEEAVNGVSDLNSKRAREEGEEEEENGCGDAKKLKVDEPVEEGRLEKLEGEEKGDDKSAPVKVGPKIFGSSVEMFDYFYKFLHCWAPNLNVNKYEHMVLLELIKKGHLEPDKKIGKGIRAFQVRYHPQFKSRCFFIIREDESVDDFSFRKCVNHILPLPENMQLKPDGNKALGGGGGKSHGCRGGGGRRGGRGRGGNSRN